MSFYEYSTCIEANVCLCSGVLLVAQVGLLPLLVPGDRRLGLRCHLCYRPSSQLCSDRLPVGPISRNAGSAFLQVPWREGCPWRGSCLVLALPGMPPLSTAPAPFLACPPSPFGGACPGSFLRRSARCGGAQARRPVSILPV